jgi:hypothetical protein
MSVDIDAYCSALTLCAMLDFQRAAAHAQGGIRAEDKMRERRLATA